MYTFAASLQWFTEPDVRFGYQPETGVIWCLFESAREVSPSVNIHQKLFYWSKISSTEGKSINGG